MKDLTMKFNTLKHMIAVEKSEADAIQGRYQELAVQHRCPAILSMAWHEDSVDMVISAVRGKDIAVGHFLAGRAADAVLRKYEQLKSTRPHESLP